MHASSSPNLSRGEPQTPIKYPNPSSNSERKNRPSAIPRPASLLKPTRPLSIIPKGLSTNSFPSTKQSHTAPKPIHSIPSLSALIDDSLQVNGAEDEKKEKPTRVALSNVANKVSEHDQNKKLPSVPSLPKSPRTPKSSPKPTTKNGQAKSKALAYITMEANLSTPVKKKPQSSLPSFVKTRHAPKSSPPSSINNDVFLASASEGVAIQLYTAGEGNKWKIEEIVRRENNLRQREEELMRREERIKSLLALVQEESEKLEVGPMINQVSTTRSEDALTRSRNVIPNPKARDRSPRKVVEPSASISASKLSKAKSLILTPPKTPVSADDRFKSWTFPKKAFTPVSLLQSTAERPVNFWLHDIIIEEEEQAYERALRDGLPPPVSSLPWPVCPGLSDGDEDGDVTPLHKVAKTEKKNRSARRLLSFSKENSDKHQGKPTGPATPSKRHVRRPTPANPHKASFLEQIWDMFLWYVLPIFLLNVPTFADNALYPVVRQKLRTYASPDQIILA